MLLLVATAACGNGKPDTPPATTREVTVESSDDKCLLTPGKVLPGSIRFEIRNTGREATEFYVYGPDRKILGEEDNIEAGRTGTMIIELYPGTFETACKPGHREPGPGLRQPVLVVEGGNAPSDSIGNLKRRAARDYKTWVEGQVSELLKETRSFTNAIKKKDLERARKLFAPTRVYYESIEPVAEKIGGRQGEIDANIDERRMDPTAVREWTGFHRLERSLWETRALTEEDGKIADRLLVDIQRLKTQIAAEEFNALDLSNGAASLLAEVATTKITGEENEYAGTDLSDFAANVDGAKTAIKYLREPLLVRDTKLWLDIVTEFDKIEAVLERHRIPGKGWKNYRDVTLAERRALQNALNAIAEPVSKVTAVIKG
ncbi:peptidase M75 family protein [Streptosporangium fragile]|uniref:Peptidase M75 family protein n=1 Tax=Streptosporangium fragile TaxID=46186 RepID=A0ABN3VZS2_9ACTN